MVPETRYAAWVNYGDAADGFGAMGAEGEPVSGAGADRQQGPRTQEASSRVNDSTDGVRHRRQRVDGTLFDAPTVALGADQHLMQ